MQHAQEVAGAVVVLARTRIRTARGLVTAVLASFNAYRHGATMPSLARECRPAEGRRKHRRQQDGKQNRR
jgi:hypothetical protein